MDVIFDIDGTLADATHRLPLIKDPALWVGTPPKPDWETFLADDNVAKDAPIPETFQLLETMLSLSGDYRVIFITGRNETTREMTYNWLRGDRKCPARSGANYWWELRSHAKGHEVGPIIYMRKEGDRRPSHVVKEELLQQARMDGFDPKLVFEDRADDTAMWRRNGLICAQVAEGKY